MGRGARTKGQLKNKVTNEVMSFQYNPGKIASDRAIDYAMVDSCGASYPSLHYVGGGIKVIKLSLLMYGKSEVERQLRFLDNAVPEINRFGKFETPPHLLYIFGKTVHTTVITKYNKDEVAFDGDLNPIKVEVELELKVIS